MGHAWKAVDFGDDRVASAAASTLAAGPFGVLRDRFMASDTKFLNETACACVQCL